MDLEVIRSDGDSTEKERVQNGSQVISIVSLTIYVVSLVIPERCGSGHMRADLPTPRFEMDKPMLERKDTITP